jgi:hypothetical protein
MAGIFQKDHFAQVEAKRRKAERKKRHARRKSRRSRRYSEGVKSLKRFFNRLFSNPFAPRKLTEAEQERLRMRRHRMHEREHDRKKWWARFRKNPVKAVFARKKRSKGGYVGGYRMSFRERRENLKLLWRRFHHTFIHVISTPELRKKFLFTFLQSTAYFLLTFFFIYIIYQAVTIAVASSFRIPVIWYYYRLVFPLYTYSPLYTRAALVTIFASGPVASLLISLAFLRLYFTRNNELVRRFKLLFLWGFVNGLNMFFGAYIAGFLTRTEFIYSSEWVFMSSRFDVEEIIFTVISITLLVVIGRIITPLFLLSSGSITLVKPENRFLYILVQVIFPWLAGALILFLITLPKFYVPLILKTLTPVFALFPSLLLYNSVQNENIHKTGAIQHNYFRWGMVIFVIALLFFYRVILSWGLRIS